VKPRGAPFTGMFLAAALAPLGSTMIAVALPSISSELGVPGPALTQWLVASYLIAGVAAMSPGGKLGDIIGHRRVLMLGMSVYAAGSLLGFLVATLPTLTVARIAMAVGGAMVTPATMALVRNAVPEERRPRTFGYLGSVLGTAAAIGPLVGGELVARFGWRAVFVANLPVLLVAFGLIHSWQPSSVDRVAGARRARFDLVGSTLLTAALVLLVAASRMHGLLMASALAAGAALLVAFVVRERRSAEPVLDLRLFGRREFAAGSIVIAMQNLAMYSLLFQVPMFFEHVRHIHKGTTGRTVIGMMIAMVVLAPIGGRLAERLGARLVAVAGCVLSLVGVLALADFSRLAAPADALPGLILVGMGLGLATSPSQSAAMTAVDRERAGMAGGALSTSRYLGGVIGISLLGALLGTAPGVAAHRNAALCYVAALVVATIASALLPGRVPSPSRVIEPVQTA